MEIKIKPIGFVRRPKAEDVRDRSLVSRIIVQRDLTEALDGLEDFSHLFIIFYLHQVSAEEKRTLKVHPRGRIDLPLVGVFSTRTASRPNPIGLTLVELLERKENSLLVRGLDAFDGTPVLDLKPADSLDMSKNLRVPKWLKLLENERQSRAFRNIDLQHSSTRVSDPERTDLNEHKLSEEESFKLILSVLKAAGKPLTTRDIEGEIRKRLVSCPDSLPMLLNRLRLRGEVKGQLSTERRGWIWCIETKR